MSSLRKLLWLSSLVLACGGTGADPVVQGAPGGQGGASGSGASQGGGSGKGGGAGGASGKGGPAGSGAGGEGATGKSGQGGEGGCAPVLFEPGASSYPVELGGQQAWVHDEGFSSGYFMTFDAFAPAGEAPRKIHVFLPRDYTQGCARYPVVYMNDGVTTFWPGGPGSKSWDVAQGLEKVYAQGAVRPVIVVAIHALDRNVEYSHVEWSPGEPCCGVEGYADYVGDRVKGFIDQHFRTLAGPEDTAIVGSSRGGLCAFLLPNLRPDRFRKAGCLSSSFWLGLDPVFSEQGAGGPLSTSKLLDMTAGTLDDPARRPTLWIDWGLVFTGGFHNEVIEKAAAKRGKEMVGLLVESHGYQVGKDLFWAEDPQGEHDEISWARRFPDVMKALFPSTP